MKSRSRLLAEKSLSAMLAAIDVYNKVSFNYRGDAFAILAVNAWELLMKARLLQHDRNRIAGILSYERRTNSDGTPSKRLRPRVGRSGAPHTIGIFAAYDRLTGTYREPLPAAVRANLEALVELRDASVHFVNDDAHFATTLHELSAACVKNYVALVTDWFALDLSSYRIFLMPLAFAPPPHTVQAVSVASKEQKFMEYVAALLAAHDDAADDYNVAVRIEFSVQRSKDVGAAPIIVSADPGAVHVQLGEADMREKYPWDFQMLTGRLSARYSDFKANDRYHQIRQPLERDAKYCYERFLDPGNPKSNVKRFYNPNILKVFDDKYARRKP